MKYFVRLAFASALILALVPALPLRAQDSAGAAEPSGRITGRVLAADGKTPVAGARILAYHLSSEQLFQSEPTTGKARYEITGLPYGYFDLAVQTPEGLFVGDQVVNLAPATKAEVTLTVTPTGALAASARGALRAYPGNEADPAGLAALDQKPLGQDFWRSPKGVAILTAGGGAILLAIAAGDDNENDISPFIP